ncbi:MAG: GGDEF and EAL domain-containing protein [Lachnospiraceae bacterium]|nr:GGDEF and EAL domain-containing protein [Lachnospiraceae bacterium]
MDNKIPEDRLRRLDSIFEALNTVAEGTYVYLCDMKYDYSRWSRSAIYAFGLPSEYMYEAGKTWETFVHPEDREGYRKSIEEIFYGGDTEHDMQYRARKRNGEYDVCTCRGVVIRDAEGNPEYFGGAIRNHDALGNVDSLTGLKNQYGFFEDLSNYIARKRPVQIIMTGISRFTELNEIYGYLFGNSVLQRFGRYLYDYVGNRGHVYRLDGTKFAVISSTQTVEEIKDIYNKLRTHFRDGFNVEGRNIILDLSAGLFSLDSFSVDVKTVYTCLYFAYGESKVRQQGYIVEFFNELNDNNRKRIEKLHVIRACINRGFEGFCLYYQPVVDAETEKLIGAEALIRWKSPEYGLVMPDEFITLLERDTLFPKLGKWILKQAMLDCKEILKNIPGFVINVNLSYTQLEKPGFADMVLNLLEETGYPAENLCLEITERCRLLDVGLLKNILVRLKTSGVKFALDDFGTGFSSIGLVKNLPFDIIKIDRSFVLRIEEDARERELIKKFAETASIFGARVCVEGIENTGMRDILKNYAVKSFQGYYYSKPLDLDSFMKWEETRR